jgi:hypothetical protein
VVRSVTWCERDDLFAAAKARLLPQPFGALFAIRTFDEGSKRDVPDVPLFGLESSAHHAVSRLFRNTRRMLRRRAGVS